MITVRRLVKRYAETTALDNLDLTVRRGVIFGLLGPNGAGKTTLVSVLNGLLPFESGEVEILGIPLRTGVREIRRRSSLVPQTPAFYDRLTVLENLRFFGGLQKITGPALHRSIDHAVRAVQLESCRNKPATNLSGGQQRRLNIAIGLLNDPDILYFDEPTVGIDAAARSEILETIRSFRDADKTVVYASHYVPEIEKICDDAAIIDHGTIVRHGPIETLLREHGSDSAVIELLRSSTIKTDAILRRFPEIERVDGSTLIVPYRSVKEIAEVLRRLEQEGLLPRNVRCGTTSLEALYLRVTRKGDHDA